LSTVSLEDVYVELVGKGIAEEEEEHAAELEGVTA
jgi:hypothetical protein